MSDVRELEALQRIVAEGSSEDFERDTAALAGSLHAIGVASGSDAVLLSLAAIGVGPGDEVVVSALAGRATHLAVRQLGAIPVAVDVDESTLELDASLVPASVSERTRAIVCALEQARPEGRAVLGELASAFAIPLLEAGSTVGRSRAGLAAAIDLGPGALLGAPGAAGLVLTDEGSLAGAVRELVHRGERDGVVVGLDRGIDALHAAVLRRRRSSVGSESEARRGRAALLDLLILESGLSPSRLRLLARAPDRAVLRVHGGAGDVAPALERLGVAVQRFRAPVGAETVCPVAHQIAAEALGLPLDDTLTPLRIEEAVDAIAAVLS